MSQCGERELTGGRIWGKKWGIWSYKRLQCLFLTVLAAEGVHLWVDGAGAEEVFCGAINVQIKHEMYLRGLCPCVFVYQSASRFQGGSCASSPPWRVSPAIK